MAITIWRGPAPEEIRKAQWELVREIESNLYTTSGQAGWEVHSTASDLLQRVRGEAVTPQGWAVRLAEGVVELMKQVVVGRQGIAALQTQVNWLEGERRCLQAQLEEQDRVALVAEVERLRAQLRKAEAWQGRVRELERALAEESRRHQQEKARLQEQLAELNRIVGMQQLQLNELLGRE